MNILSAMLSPRLEINNSHIGNAFNIVVGDSNIDRLVYWNARSHFPKWRDSGCVDLRVPVSLLGDTATTDAIGDFLQRRNQVTRDGGGTPLAVLRSSSQSEADLDAFASVLKKKHPWAQFRAKRFTSPDVCIPTPAQLASSLFVTKDSWLGQSSSMWTEASFQENEIRISPPAPEHLRYASTALLSPHEGAWAVELDIQRTIDNSRYSNEQQSWRLPRRLRMTSSFVKPYPLQSMGNHIMPRVASGGLLTLYANNGDKFPAVKQPEDAQVFRRAFTRGKDWRDFSSKPSEPRLMQLCNEIRRSENGRYFWGVLQMFGDLNAANRFLLSKFWQEQFTKLAAIMHGVDCFAAPSTAFA